jgi:hypothetical protein
LLGKSIVSDDLWAANNRIRRREDFKQNAATLTRLFKLRSCKIARNILAGRPRQSVGPPSSIECVLASVELACGAIIKRKQRSQSIDEYQVIVHSVAPGIAM